MKYIVLFALALVLVQVVAEQSKLTTFKKKMSKARVHKHKGKKDNDGCFDITDDEHVHDGYAHGHDDHHPQPCMVEPEYAEPPTPITDLSDLSTLSDISAARARGAVAPWIQQVPVNTVAYGPHPLDPHPVFPSNRGCTGDGCTATDVVHPEYAAFHPPVGLKHSTDTLFDPAYALAEDLNQDAMTRDDEDDVVAVTEDSEDSEATDDAETTDDAATDDAETTDDAATDDAATTDDA